MSTSALYNVVETEFTGLNKVFSQQKKAFNKNCYPEYQERLRDLINLKSVLLKGQDEIQDALIKDFGNRAEIDTKIGDLLTTILGINYTIKHLKNWMKPSKRQVSLLFQPAKAYVEYQPLGVIGVIVPWNYPVFLSMIPLATALAAGNRVMIKMSEFTPSTNRVLAKLLKEAFKEDQVAIVEGEADVASEFSHLPFNHLFFTGSTQVGKKVMEAASKNLVPVTLELGGKSPTIIDDQIDLTKAVDRFIFGKTLNSGQTCVAPDYILCPRSRVDELVAILKTRYSELYPTFDCNSDITSIINKRQFNRIQDALKQALESGAKVIPLADHNAETSAAKRKIPLTVVLDASAKSTIMNDEIFGPILPIVPYDNINDAIDFVSERERPLALYIYSFDKSFQNHVMRNTHAGSVAINDAAFQVAMEDLPFGGIGGSGMGKCHGHEGFLSFSHSKSVLKRGRLSFGSLLFPPYSNLIHKLVFKLFIR